MAFRRKDVKKASYYVWFLGARESAGLRGEQFILPVLAHLLRQERVREPVKVTLQVSSKGLKIVQNVCRNKESKPSQVKHVIPSASITCALQSEDVVSVVLLLFNPLTGCPIHVHAYRCDSLATAFGLRSQLQTLIDRPENQRKFAEIETRLAAKGLLSEQYMNKHSRLNKQTDVNKTNTATTSIHHTQQHASVVPIAFNGIAISHSNSTRLPAQDKNATQQAANLKPLNDSMSRQLQSRSACNQHTLTSDGRSAGGDESSEDATGSNSERDGRSPVDPIVAVMYESLAAELKAKLGNPEVAPILLPPRDYDTICRSHGQVLERTERKCTNKLLIGKPGPVDEKMPSKVQLNKNVQSTNNPNIDKNKKANIPQVNSSATSGNQTDNACNNKTTSVSSDNNGKLKEPVKPPRNRGPASLAQQEAGCEEIIQKTDQVRKKSEKVSGQCITQPNVNTCESKHKSNDQLDSCAQVQVHSQVRLERLRAEKAKVAAKLEQLEQMEQLERATAESARKHAINQLNRTTSNSDGKTSKQVANNLHKSNKLNGNANEGKQTEQLNPKLITQHGLKQIGSSLANKIRQTLFVSSNSNSNRSAGKQSPQLIRHQMLHSSQPDLRLPVESSDATVSKNQTLEAPIVMLKNGQKSQPLLISNAKCLTSLEPLDGKHSSASSGKSASSGIGSSRLAINGFEDELGFGSTDEELDLEILRRNGSASASGDSQTEDSGTRCDGKWHDRTQATRNATNILINDKQNRCDSQPAFDEGLDYEDEDEYFINNELELDERPMQMRNAVISSDEEHSSAICYDDNLMPQIERSRTRRRATSVESAVRNQVKTSKSNGLVVAGKLNQLEDADLIHQVESLPPVSRQACLRRSETCVRNDSNEPIKRAQNTTHLLLNSTSNSNHKISTDIIHVTGNNGNISNINNINNISNNSHNGHKTRSNNLAGKVTNKRHSTAVAIPYKESFKSHPERSFYYPHVPNDACSARPQYHYPHQIGVELKRQVSTPSLLHSSPTAAPVGSTSGQPYSRHAFGSRSAVSNSQLHLLSAQPFRLRSKPLHAFVSGF